MEIKRKATSPAINTQAIAGLTFGILTILFLCLGLFPLPLTSLVCFPLSLLFGLLALIFGVISLKQTRQRDEAGRPLAWIGIIAGGFVLICVTCMAMAIGAIFLFSPRSIHLPPFIQNFQVQSTDSLRIYLLSVILASGSG